MPTTIFGPVTLTSDNAGLNGNSFRTEASLSAGSLGQVRATLHAPTTTTYGTSHCAIGISKRDGTGSTISTPVELTFSGASGFSIAANASITSDWVTFAFLSTDFLIVIQDLNQDNWAFGSGSCDTYYKSATTSWNTATTAGFNVGGGLSFDLASIETQAAGAAFLAKPPISILQAVKRASYW